MRRTLACLLLLTIAYAGAAAQAGPVPPGSRVRVTSPMLGDAPRIGTAVTFRSDTLVFQRAGSQAVVIPASALTRLELSTGRHRPILKGMGIGFLVGAATGVILGFASGDSENGWWDWTAEQKAGIGGSVLGTVGALAGAVIGATRVTETWTRVSLGSAATGVGPSPNGRGVGLAISVHF